MRENANFYSSRDPFEDMSSFGSRTTPVGFYNGQTYDGYTTLDSASPYGLYDMAGNVWQWTGDVHLTKACTPLHARRLEGHLRHGLARLGSQQRHSDVLQPGRWLSLRPVVSLELQEC